MIYVSLSSGYPSLDKVPHSPAMLSEAKRMAAGPK